MRYLVVVVLFFAVAPCHAQSTRDVPGGRPSLASVRAWIEGGEGKLSATEVVARLGPPERMVQLDGSDGIAMTWDDIAWIRVFFRGGKVRRLDGRFPPPAADGAITLATFRKLRPGMTRKAVESLLGMPDEERLFMKDVQRCEWVQHAELTAAFTRDRLGDLDLSPTADVRPVGVRPPLTKETRQWLEQGRGKLTERAVYRKMGLPDFVFNPGDPDTGEGSDEVGMIWREQARIEVDFKDDNAWKLKGEFAPHARSERINFANFRKLQCGMKEVRVEETLGPADEETRPERGVRRQIWVARQEFIVYFRAGKVSNVTWWGPF
jgi:hypothetical protein